MQKVMLIYPPFTQPLQSKKRCLVPLGIAYIGAYLRKNNINVKLLDCVVEGYNHEVTDNQKITFGLSIKDIKKQIQDFNPDFVGVSCLMTLQFNNALSVCKAVKAINPNIHVVIGGCHPSVFSYEMISYPEIDSVVIGEGEQAMLDIVQGKTKGIVKKPIMDINTIPEPARDLLPINKYLKINMPENIFSPNDRVTQVVSSKGCPFNCIYCATTNFHGRWRGRKAKDVIAEAKMLKEKYRIDEINFVDENLVMNKERTIEIMKGFKELNIAWSNPGGIWIDGLDNELLDLMKEAGCYQLTFPVETTNKNILKNVINKPLHLERVEPLVKHCHKIGIDVHAFFICGFPEQTKQDMIDDFEYAKRVEFDSASFNIITPLPGSRIFTKYANSTDLTDINYIHATIPHPTLTKQEIEILVDNFNKDFNKLLETRDPTKFYNKYIKTAKKKFNEKDATSLLKRV